MRAHRICILALFVATSSLAAASSADKAVLTLDGLSFVSFDDNQIYSIPAGTKLVFRFGPASGDTLPFELHPDDFNWPPLGLDGQGETLRFGLADAARGSLIYAGDRSASITFDARLRVQLDHPTSPGMKEILLRFTTGTASAERADGAASVSVAGMRVPVGARAVQLVGVRANSADDYPGPGAVVSVVLSGVFDRLPGLEGR